MSRLGAKISITTALLALAAAGTGHAQTPAETVYQPKAEVKSIIEQGGGPVVPPAVVPPDVIPPAVNPPLQEAEEEGGARAPIPTPRRRETGGSPAPIAAAPGGDLPFTGFEAGIAALAGLALLGTGLAMRRVARGNR